MKSRLTRMSLDRSSNSAFRPKVRHALLCFTALEPCRFRNVLQVAGATASSSAMRAQAHKTLAGSGTALRSDQVRREAHTFTELRSKLMRGFARCAYSSPGLERRLLHRPGLARFGFLQMLPRSMSRKAQVRKGALSRVRNRCVVSGHNSALANFGLSRIAFRTSAHRGEIPGLRKL